MSSFDLPGMLRRIRRLADLSQRELAEALQSAKSTIAAAETGRRGLDVRLLARAAELAGLQVALIDALNEPVAGMQADAVRDEAGRLFPAHLDTRYGDQDWWHGPERYARAQPWYTFDRSRRTRDLWRHRTGTPDDHQLPQPGDSPRERAAARTEAARERHSRMIEALRAAGLLRPPVEFECTCPPECDLLHTEHCPCRCDVS